MIYCHVEGRTTLYGERNQPEPLITLISGGFHQPLVPQPPYNAFDCRRIHCRQPPKLVLRQRPGLAQTRQNRKLGWGQTLHMFCKDRDMALVRPPQIISDLPGKVIRVRRLQVVWHVQSIDSLRALPQHPLVYKQNCTATTDSDLYQRPDTLNDALAILADGDWQIAAGCTDLFPGTQHKTLQGATLDITAIDALRGISQSDDGVRIGATTTWSDIITADLPACFDGLKLAAREVGATQIQNRGTLAGNLCNASPAADGVPPLLTLDASVEVSRAGAERRIPLAEFILGPRHVALQPGEMVTAIHVPSSALAGRGHFLKLGARKYLVISISMTAVRIAVEDGVVTQAALAVGSCGPVATRLPAVESALIGQPLDPALISDAAVAETISPIDDIRADATYRATSAAELMRRTVEAIA